MSALFKPRLSILPPSQYQLWPELKPAVDLGFVLYGGTAIALRLGHRTSIDFDFFSDQALNRETLKKKFSFIQKSTVLLDRQDTFCILVPSGVAEPSTVKVSFFGTIDFGRVGEPELTDDRVLQIASLDDLMATKLKVILQRSEAKDYRDIVAMVNANVSVAKGLSAARAMFGKSFQASESLKALVYFKDGDLDTLTKIEKTCLVKVASEVQHLPELAIISQQLAISS